MIQQREFQEADQAIFNEGFSTVVVQIPENERPLLKLGSLLDWRMGGVISDFIRDGKITGVESECTLIPATKAGKHFQIIALGMGKAKTPGHRTELSVERSKILQKNLKQLQSKKIFASLSDLGVAKAEDLKSIFNIAGIDLRLGG